MRRNDRISQTACADTDKRLGGGEKCNCPLRVIIHIDGKASEKGKRKLMKIASYSQGCNNNSSSSSSSSSSIPSS